MVALTVMLACVLQTVYGYSYIPDFSQTDG